MCYCAALFHFVTDGTADCFRGVAELMMIPEWSLLLTAVHNYKESLHSSEILGCSSSNLFSLEYIDLVNLP